MCALRPGSGAAREAALRFERIPTDDPSCSNSGSDVVDLNNVGAVLGRRCIDSGFFAFIAHEGTITLLPQDEEGNASQLRLNDRFDVAMSVSTAAAGRRNLLALNDGTAVEVKPLPGDFHLTLIGVE